jgi:hypothetical protein
MIYFLKVKMGIITNRLFVTLLFFLGSIVLFAGPTPPPPNFKKPPPPPGLPIDEYSVLCGLMAILFGLYVIYNHKTKTKTPM